MRASAGPPREQRREHVLGPVHERALGEEIEDRGLEHVDAAVAEVRQRLRGIGLLLESSHTPVAIVQQGHTPEEASTALIAEIEKLKTEPISTRELQRSKNQFARDYILGRESNQQKASTLAHAVVIHHDIKTADGEFDIFQNISVADVQRVARTYFRPENRIVLTLMPSGANQ